MTFYFKNTKKDINMTKEVEKDYRNNNICRFCEREILSIKFVIIVTQLVNTEVQLLILVI